MILYALYNLNTLIARIYWVQYGSKFNILHTGYVMEKFKFNILHTGYVMEKFTNYAINTASALREPMNTTLRVNEYCS